MRVLTFIVTTFLLMPADAWAAPGNCCDDHKCCANAACCKHDTGAAAVDPMDQIEPDPAPVREYAKVVFQNPVRVGDRVLFGQYVIEHDNDRMARGEPCTHIYAASDRRLPVVAFHCRHLRRTANRTATVTIRRVPDLTTRIFELVEFQFEGSAEGHGVPDRR